MFFRTEVTPGTSANPFESALGQSTPVDVALGAVVDVVVLEVVDADDVVVDVVFEVVFEDVEVVVVVVADQVFVVDHTAPLHVTACVTLDLVHAVLSLARYAQPVQPPRAPCAE
jgi:hypothetical protein